MEIRSSLPAISKSHGVLLAAITNTCSSVLQPLNPSIWISNSVFIRLEASCSFASLLLELRIESISSRKIVDGAWCLARSKRARTSFSESPLHLLTRVEAEMLKNVVLHSDSSGVYICKSVVNDIRHMEITYAMKTQ